jgi:hypothetical protein
MLSSEPSIFCSASEPVVLNFPMKRRSRLAFSKIYFSSSFLLGGIGETVGVSAD